MNCHSRKDLRQIGMRALGFPRRCPCGKLTEMTSIKHKGITCYECVMTEHKEMVIRPRRVLTGILALVLMCCVGCQSPRQANIEVRVAGQEVVMNFKR
jgi:hypothetical protein